jgi:hypothetical protein
VLACGYLRCQSSAGSDAVRRKRTGLNLHSGHVAGAIIQDELRFDGCGGRNRSRQETVELPKNASLHSESSME